MLNGCSSSLRFGFLIRSSVVQVCCRWRELFRRWASVMPSASPETRRASTGAAAVSPRSRISSMPPRTTDVPSSPSNAAAFATLRGHGHTSWRHKRGEDPSQRVATLRGREVRGVANIPSPTAGGRSISNSSELGGARATIAPVPAPSGSTQVATPPPAGDEQEDEGGQQRVGRGWLARVVVRCGGGCLLTREKRRAKQQRRIAPDKLS